MIICMKVEATVECAGTAAGVTGCSLKKKERKKRISYWLDWMR